MRSLLGRTPLLALASLLIGCFCLASCDREPVAPVTPPGSPPTVSGGDVLGLVQVTISGIGSSDMHASASAVGTSTLGAPASGVSLDLTPVPGADGSIQLASLSSGSFTEGERGNGGERYLYATFKVRNATSGGTAYSTPRTNLTFLAVSTPSTIDGTAISQMNKFDGSAAAPDIATQLLPTGAVTQNPATGERSSASSDVLQVLTEAEAASFTAPPSVSTVFPYGFVVRNPNTANSRTLPANPRPDQFDGLVTFAFRVPLQASSRDDPFTVSALFLAVDDGETRLTQSLEEQDAAATDALEVRAHALNASELTLLPGGMGGGVATVRRVCSVRTAGPASAPTATLVNSTGALLQSLTPNPYATDGSGSFIASPTSFTAQYSDAITATPTAENFVVNGSQSGRHFLGQSYDGAGTNTITSPSGTFFPGEEVEVVLTSALDGCGAPKVARLRVKAPTASSGPTIVGRSFDVGGTALALADLNGDGKLDVVTSDSNAISVLLGDGAGGFQAPVDYAAGTGASSPAVGDLNGDGALDIVVSNFRSSSVSVLLGAGDGSFPTHTDYAVAPYPQGLAIGDLNGDGRLDLVVGANPDSLSQSTGAVSVLLGNGDGTFQTHKEYATPYGVFKVRLADLGNDGTLDIITVNQEDQVTQDASGNAMSVLLGNGDGTFQRHFEHSLPQGYNPLEVAVGDVNADGFPDLVIGDRAFQRADVSVLLSDRYGSLGSPVQISTGGPGYVTGVAISDVNGDGKLDIVAASQGAGVNQYGSISILFGQGDGTFPTNTQLSAGTPQPVRVTTGDLNGDGKLDVVFTSSFDGRASIATRMNQ